MIDTLPIVKGTGTDEGPSPQADPRPVLITGGTGFVGTNLADRLLSDGQLVLVFDNLSRPGVERNLQWLRTRHPERLQIEIADIRDPQKVREAVHRADRIYHFAAQVAVTTSIEAPLTDLEINVQGTVNLLEAIRSAAHPPPLVYTSTNKVYGNLPDLAVHRRGKRYLPRDATIAARGIAENRPLAFHSPYGCSKGAADQYILDYARTYGLLTAVVRMSCIYGPHQFGTEDQGWVAHFLIRALQDHPITIYGDGLQVRDILYVEDLVEALLGLQKHMDRVRGQVFNIGGGPTHTISLLELVELLGEIHGRRPELNFAPWRMGDQKYYVSDTRKLAQAIDWAPKYSVRDGVRATYAWLQMYASRHSGYNPAVVSMQRRG